MAATAADDASGPAYGAGDAGITAGVLPRDTLRASLIPSLSGSAAAPSDTASLASPDRHSTSSRRPASLVLSNALARQLAPGGYHVTTSDELERENRHFVMSDAIIEAMEQAKQVIPYFDPSASYGSGLTLCNGGGGSTGSRTPSRTNSMVSSALRTVSTAASALNTISSPGWHRALDSEPATPLASVCTTDDGTSDDAAGRETVRPDSRSADSPLRREVCSLRAVSEGRAVVDSASEDCGSSETTGVGGGNGGKAMVEGTEQLTLLQKSPGSPLPRLVPARSLRFREDEGDDNSEDPDGGTEVDDASEYTDVMMEPQRAGSDYSGAGGGAGGAGSDSAGAFALGLPPPPLSDDVGWHLSSSPASVALGFLRSMGGDEALAASAQLLVGETEDVPQALLPLPVLNLRDVGSHHSDDPQALAFPQIQSGPIFRGNDEWAPPRNQIIFTVHKRTTSKAAAIQQQGYRCAGCGIRVELNFTRKFRYCEYLGKYFCTSCHAGAQRVIPARVMHNWDFRQYRVSSFSAHLLDNVRTQPLFDFRVVNEPALRRVKALATATTLRRQLGHLRAYLMACRGGTSLLQTIEDPPHMATEQTLYSMKDLVELHSGALLKHLSKLVELGTEHVKECPLCQAKGYICELCRRANDVIFPFEINKAMECPACHAVYHLKCWNKAQAKCPKCERIAQREAKRAAEAALLAKLEAAEAEAAGAAAAQESTA